ncbi:MAG: tetratricopeptide repeat protein [Candidatus Cloacimonas sp.]|jgi:tetratricopeptide (TPR) repeat protein|nr:tetratricopeptide repeat protein [Candidatus Cloacimonas sp.]
MKKLIIVATALLLLISACATGRQKLSPQGNVDFKTANVYYAQKNVEQAEKYYAKVLVDNPEHAEALRRMADINLFNGETFAARAVEFNQKAYEYYAKAITNTEAFPNLTDQEKIDLRDMKKRKESSWTRIYKIAENEETEGNTQAAMATYELVAKLDPNRPEPMIKLKNIYLNELKDDAKAEQILLSLIKDDPDKLVYLQELGAYYYNKENYAEAVKYFEKAKLQMPRSVDNMMNISACYYELKDYPKAMAATELALNLDPTSIDLLDNARSIAAMMNDKDLSLSYLKQLIEIRSNEEDFIAILGILMEKENYPELITYAEKWYNWDKENKFPVQYLKLAAVKTGNKSMEAKYDAILKKMP